jgi:hypothetical protein
MDQLELLSSGELGTERIGAFRIPTPDGLPRPIKRCREVILSEIITVVMRM